MTWVRTVQNYISVSPSNGWRRWNLKVPGVTEAVAEAGTCSDTMERGTDDSVLTENTTPFIFSVASLSLTMLSHGSFVLPSFG